MAVHRKLVAAALCLALPGCATARTAHSVLGRRVEVEISGATAEQRPKGELIAVGPEQLYVLEPGGVRALPLSGIGEVRVRRHGLNGKRAMRWVGLGALLSGGALAGACSSVEGNGGGCFGIGAIVAATWALIGLPAAVSLGRSSELRVRPPGWDALKPYARFPQGAPEGLDLNGLSPKAAATEAK